MTFRHSICNEAFEKWPFADACKAIRKIGYTGIEIAPFTLSERPGDVTAAQRREYRDIMQSEGLAFVGLHWLMVSPKGLHVTTPDDALRARSWQHIRDLIDLCADLGPDGVMVFGSPKQRSTTGGLSREQATRNYIDGLASVAPQAAERGVTVLVEALPIDQCDVILTLEEAAGIVREIDSPGVRTMFDVHNAINEIRAARRPGGPVVRLHPARPRERARRQTLRRRRVRLQAGAGDPRPSRIRRLDLARGLRFHPRRRSAWRRHRCATWKGKSPN